MRRGPVFWTPLLVLGALLWLTSVGVWDHPLYRLVLMLVALSWFGYVVWAPKSTDSLPEILSTRRSPRRPALVEKGGAW